MHEVAADEEATADGAVERTDDLLNHVCDRDGDDLFSVNRMDCRQRIRGTRPEKRERPHMRSRMRKARKVRHTLEHRKTQCMHVGNNRS